LGFALKRIAADQIYSRFLLADLKRHLGRRGYNPNQPRDDHGRWTSEDGQDADAAKPVTSGETVNAWSRRAPLSVDDFGRPLDDLTKAPTYPYGPQYSPDRLGWHDYVVGPNLICTADQHCTRAEIVDQLTRYAVPGQDPGRPVTIETMACRNRHHRSIFS